MSNIKLIATDLDGTFLMNETDPHPENIEAVKECLRRGIRVCACTGRCFGNVRGVIRRGGLDKLCVINNGSSVVDYTTGEHRYRSRFDPAKVRDILAYGIEHGAETTVQGFTTLYSYRPHASFLIKVFEALNAYPEGEQAEILFLDSLDELVAACREDTETVSFRMDVHAGVADVWDDLNEITEVEITSSLPGNMEISAKGGNKQTGLSVLADIYDVDPENVMALGDNFNDMGMLMWAGTGVAMGNADDRLKSMANYVTGRNYEAGVAQAIYELVLD